MPPKSKKQKISNVPVPKGQTTLTSLFNFPQTQRNEGTRLEEVSPQDSAQHLSDIRCERDTCNGKPCFNYLDEGAEFIPKYCETHKLEGMVNILPPKEKDPNIWVNKNTLAKWKREKQWLDFKILEEKKDKPNIFYRGIATCKWCKYCEADLPKFNLRKIPPFVAGYKDFASFKARMNEHDGSSATATKSLGATVMSTPKFHRYSSAKVNKHQVLAESPLVQHLNSSTSLSEEFKTITGNRMRVSNLVGKQKYALSAYTNIVKVVGQCGGRIGKQGDHTTDRGSKYYTALIAKQINNEETERVCGSKYCSMSADGSIGHDHKAGEVVRLRIFNKQHTGKEVEDLFVGIAQLKREDAAGTLQGIKEQLRRVGVNLDDAVFLELLADIYGGKPIELPFRMVNANFDGASVNMGVNSGVAQLLKQLFPWIIITHCVNHNLELAILDTKKGCPYMEQFNETVKIVFKCYHYSAKRRNEFEEICESANEECKHFGGIQTIRWAASANRALLSIKHNWRLTIDHLGNISNERNADAAWAVGLLRELCRKTFLLHLHFMLDFLSPLKTISLVFQKAGCLILDVFVKLESAKGALVSIKRGNGLNMLEFKQICVENNGKFVYKGIELDSGRT